MIEKNKIKENLFEKIGLGFSVKKFCMEKNRCDLINYDLRLP